MAITFNQLNEQFHHSKYCIMYLEIDSFAEGTTRIFQVVARKTGERDKYGSPILTDHVYYQAIEQDKYVLVENPYKTNK